MKRAPRRVEHELLVDAGVERRRDRRQRQWFGECGDQATRDECHKLRTRDDMERLDIAGHDERDAPLQSLGSEPAVDQVGVLAADDDGDGPRIEENIAPLQLRTNGMAWPNRATVTIS